MEANPQKAQMYIYEDKHDKRETDIHTVTGKRTEKKIIFKLKFKFKYNASKALKTKRNRISS
eukprot:snap_masked-scaffold_15-processed-gene-4.49-mRNA-1 protein AED:1.00 eAED:1.00 QI:0/-1/0/0/-1/1/1/0/61